MVKHDTYHLPTPESIGDPPRQPRVVTKLAETWAAQLEDKFAQSALPDAGPYRGSMASIRCDRALQYTFAGTPKSDPPDLAALYRMNLGTMVHEAFQSIMDDAFGKDWTSEIVIDLNVIDIPGSMRIDGAQQTDDGQVPVELKTINGFGFKTSATDFKGPPAGPRSGHRLQLAFAICALDAPYGVLGYLSMENVSPSIAARLGMTHPAQQFAAEWTVSRAEADELVDRERRRIHRVLRFTNADSGPITRMLHDPDVATNAIVIDPSRGAWATMVDGKPTQTGKTWMCDYCDHRTTCIADGPGVTQLELGDDIPF